MQMTKARVSHHDASLGLHTIHLSNRSLLQKLCKSEIKAYPKDVGIKTFIISV